MILTASQMKTAEEAALMDGSTTEGLMEIAGDGISCCIRQFFPQAGTAVVFCGKGHNGGDALVAARHLRTEGWRIMVRLSCPVEELASLTRHHLHLLGVDPSDSAGGVKGNSLLLIDGLLGIGITGPPRGNVAELIRELNGLRAAGAFTIAVDLPSGLEATTGEIFDPCVQADLTVTLGFPKTGLLADASTGHVGRLAVVTLPGVRAMEETMPRSPPPPLSVTCCRSEISTPTRGTTDESGLLPDHRGILEPPDSALLPQCMQAVDLSPSMPSPKLSTNFAC